LNITPLENINSGNTLDNWSTDDLRLLSLNQSRKLLGIRYTALTDLILKGQIEYVEINNRKKIPMIKLRSFINRSSKALKDKRHIAKSFEISSIKNKLKNIIKKHGRS